MTRNEALIITKDELTEIESLVKFYADVIAPSIGIKGTAYKIEYNDGGECVSISLVWKGREGNHSDFRKSISETATAFINRVVRWLSEIVESWYKLKVQESSIGA